MMTLPAFAGGDSVDRAVFLLRNSRPTWIYGLWRREALLNNLARVGTRYNELWASDHLLMMPSVLAGRVAIEPETYFAQRILGRGSYELATSERLAARALYAEICADFLSEIEIPEARLPEFRAALEFHMDDRVGPLKRLRRRQVKERVLAALGLRRQ